MEGKYLHPSPVSCLDSGCHHFEQKQGQPHCETEPTGGEEEQREVGLGEVCHQREDERNKDKGECVREEGEGITLQDSMPAM